jgi:hypothetical protein
MAHYAFLNENNIVTEVIVGKDETDTTHDWEQYYGAIRNQVCKRTSYHGNIRKNYAGIGYTYDTTKDAFIAPQPYSSWTLDEDTFRWIPPTSMPTEGGPFTWNEETLSWVNLEQ